MVIRELVSRLGFDVDSRGAEKADKVFAGLTKAATAVVAAATTATAALLGVAKSTANAGDEVAKSARKLGVGVEELQALRYHAEQSGVAVSSLETGMERLAKDAAENGRSVMEEFLALSDTMAGMESQTDRLAYAQERFGRRGGELLLMLEDGSGAVLEATQRFEALGGAISAEGAANAEKFNDTLHDLQILFKGIVHQVGEALIPVITEIGQAIREWAIENRELIRTKVLQFVELLVAALRVFWSVAGRVVQVANNVANALGGWETTLRYIVWALGFMIATRTIKGVIALGRAIQVVGKALLFLGLGRLIRPLARLGGLVGRLWRGMAKLGRFFTLAGIRAGAMRLAIFGPKGLAAALAIIGTTLVAEKFIEWAKSGALSIDNLKAAFNAFVDEMGTLFSNVFARDWDAVLNWMQTRASDFADWVRGLFEGLLPDWMRTLAERGAQIDPTLGQQVGEHGMGSLAAQQITEGAGGGSTHHSQVHNTGTLTIEIHGTDTPEAVADNTLERVKRWWSGELNDSALLLETR